MPRPTIRVLARQLVALLLALAAVPGLQAQRVRDVQIAPPYLRMRPDAETRVLATAFDEDGNPMATSFRWFSSNINVATVTPDGLIRAVATGQTIISAVVESGGRRRTGRLSVYVTREPKALVAPGTPGVPAPPPSPGMVMVRPVPRVDSVRSAWVNVDSAIRAAVDCTNPFVNSVNPAHACWERRATAQVPPTIVTPAACGDVASAAHLLVQVGEDGRVLDVLVFRGAPCEAFTDSAVARLRAITFRPAEREGRPVRSWITIPIRPRHER